MWRVLPADVNPERLDTVLGQSLGGNNVLAAVGHCVGANMRATPTPGGHTCDYPRLNVFILFPPSPTRYPGQRLFA